LFFASPLTLSGTVMLYGVPHIPLIVFLIFGYLALRNREKLRNATAYGVQKIAGTERR